MKNKDFFSGASLYGDSFSLEEINNWYLVEEEAFANLYGKEITPNDFEYTNFDILFGYNYIPKKNYYNALGFGASWGYEFLPIINYIENLTIIESSEQTVSHCLENITPQYIKSNISGKINLPDNTYDLITVFSVLHHIPNVSFVLTELFRVLKCNGYLLIREPIHSMGNWNNQRQGLTKNERGIPKNYLWDILKSFDCEIIHYSYHYCMYSFLTRILHEPKFLRSHWYLRIDNILSTMFLWNYRYHPINKFQRICPQYIYVVIKKNKNL